MWLISSECSTTRPRRRYWKVKSSCWRAIGILMIEDALVSLNPLLNYTLHSVTEPLDVVQLTGDEADKGYEEIAGLSRPTKGAKKTVS